MSDKSSVRQSVSVGVFLVGLAWFAYQLGEMLVQHSDAGWQYFKTPMAVGEILKTAASVTLTVGGALGMNVRDLFARKVQP